MFSTWIWIWTQNRTVTVVTRCIAMDATFLLVFAVVQWPGDGRWPVWPRPAICYTNQGWIFTKCLQFHLRGKYFTIFSSMVNTAVPSVDLKIWREKDIKPNHWKIKLCRIYGINVIYLPLLPMFCLVSRPAANCWLLSGQWSQTGAPNYLTANGSHLHLHHPQRHRPHIILPYSLPACWHVTYSYLNVTSYLTLFCLSHLSTP